jgi:hydroxylamine dehydrogenase
MISTKILSRGGFHALCSFSQFPPFFSLTTVARAQVSAEGQACIDCNSSSTPGIVEQWRESAHAKKNVDCYSCHRASEKDPATFDHYGHRIAVIVT